MRYLNKTILYTSIVSFLLVFSYSLNAQWVIPEDAKNMELPIVPTYETVKKGKDLFNTNCASCHGAPGEGKNIAAINASDLGTVEFQNANTAGITFFKMNEGLGGMPSFKDKFDSDEKWNIISFIKSFEEGFKISGEKIEAYTGEIDLKINEDGKRIIAYVSVTDKDGLMVSNEGVDVVFYIKRYFGKLPIGDPVSTNEDGKAAIEFIEDIPGDEEGKIEIISSFKDKDRYGSDIKTATLNWGLPTHYVNPVLERSLWGPNDRVPLWLLFTYLFVTIGVWAGIIYVIIYILKIKKAGKKT